MKGSQSKRHNYLNNSLAETHKISSDADGSGRGHRDGDDLVVGLRRFSGDPSCGAQVFDADVVVVADDRGHLVTAFPFVLLYIKQKITRSVKLSS